MKLIYKVHPHLNQFHIHIGLKRIRNRNKFSNNHTKIPFSNKIKKNLTDTNKFIRTITKQFKIYNKSSFQSS